MTNKPSTRFSRDAESSERSAGRDRSPGSALRSEDSASRLNETVEPERGPVVYVAWMAVILLLYPACWWFARLKSRRRDVWLSYL